jgi:type 1 fimbriae regulatory protein FimB/type 1 fimbriae regulatory protein FimE
MADEIAKLIDAAANSRNGDRDALMISMAFNHALRAIELVELRWSQINFKSGQIFVSRVKNSDESTHYLQASEIRALKRLQADSNSSEFVFLSERNAPMTIRGFHKLVVLAGERAKLPFAIHPHMLRHSKGYQLANKGTDTRLIQGFMGHKNIQNTVRYTKLDAKRFRGLES